ncbi:uncharacterized protein PFL1_00971 [Pseudozyma flocculosa PF-1]|uniref:Condensin complex subunit 2 n=1 Tax=Pseudozyma flocculosa TaxID=84751 RepID=A0A5C3F8N1_9BASI|nr:uncharacterized protein PFL1_00971 [Pseudozyma flocculosa PF-1]EPQ31638.1 hypothetical protein PFL1_00971 [Pseudozyma flocculosa PF-1]SPO40752.1 related to BRN1 - protein required for chromosome condensation [Pseudozyma flocculosa]
MSTAARRAPLTESKAANTSSNRSISSSFRGSKASLVQATSDTMKSKPSSRTSSGPAARSASGRHPSRGRPKRVAEDSEEDDDSDGEVDTEQSDQDFDDSRDMRSAKQRAAAATAAKARQPGKKQAPSHQTNAAPAPPPAARSAQVAHRVAALARSHAVANAADGSLIMASRSARVGGAAGVDAPAAISVDTTSFEEWMKMATDNKINSTNTWSFALIDYFHDMSLLRNESGDGSINFQKASCTLDGCVKVWTSRVDSVVVETGKLLSGLQDEINGENAKEKRGRGGEDGADLDDDEEDFDEDGEAGGATRGRKRTRNKEATLAKNFSQIQAKKFDLEFTVDPLFKKTSADFDEGGAGGLLMNHLGVDSNGRVVFDASDVAGVGDEGDADDDPTAAAETNVKAADDEVDLMDLSKLRAKLFEGEAAYGSDGTIASLIGGRVICPSLCNFSFSESDNTPFGVGLDDVEDPGVGLAMQTDDAGMAQTMTPFDDFQDDNNVMLHGDGDGADFFSGAGRSTGPSMGVEDDDGLLGAGDDDDDGGIDFFDAPEADEGMAAAVDDAVGQGAGYGPFDHAAGPSQGDLVMAMAFNGGEGRDNDDEAGADAGLFDYFDRRLMRNWAGPEHWKMSRVGAGPLGLGGINGKKGDEGGGKAASGATTTRKSKEPFVIDFLSDEGAVDAKEIFEPAKQPGSIQLPATTRSKVSLSNSNSDAYLLPEDRHFNSRQLLKLFLKPRVAINMRRRGGSSRLNTGGIDEQFWAQAAAAHGGDVLGGDDDDSGAAMPFDTQFFHDNDEGFDPISDLAGGEHGSPSAAANGGADLEDEEIQSLAALNRIKPEYVNYAKKAKRVDVKKLKENIWKELGIITEVDGDTSTAAPADTDDNPGDDLTATTKPAAEYKTFDTVLTGLKKAYPRDKMEEISTSFCFICLLHLANEEGLQISTGSDDQPRPKRRGSAGRSRKSTTPSPFGDVDDGAGEAERTDADGMASMFEQLAKGAGGARIISSTEDDDDLGGEGWDEDDEEDQEDRIKVGKLESLRIVKDPKAFRSA